MLDKAKGIDYLNQTGVYFLFGSSDDTGELVVYIGQAGIRKNGKGILYRLDEHRRDNNKDYWTEAVAFTTSNNSFGPTEISYLENRFCNRAIDANRYTVKISNDPNHGNITEEKESELEEFIIYAKLVMGALGYKVFEPLVAPLLSQEQQVTIMHAEPLLYYKTSKAEAKGRRTAEGFMVMAGSKTATAVQKNFPESAKKYRVKYADKISVDGILSADVLCSSPSSAASFVGGSALSGYVTWKNADGLNLKQIESEE